MTVFRQPPEWAPHHWVWIGFPSHPDLWEDDLRPAQEEVAAFARAIHADGAGEPVHLVCANDAAAREAEAMTGGAAIVEVHPFGDIWLRDTGPILVSDGRMVEARSFLFNGWGNKYRLEGDDDVGVRLAKAAGLPLRSCHWVLEGGAIDVDGTGLCVTTEQCLLNPNRNPSLQRHEVEARLKGDLGLTDILWLGDGLAGDHTDGHVDNLARFVAPRRIALPRAATGDDPNAAAYEDAARRIEAAGIDLARLPSPGRIEVDGKPIAASYMNFYLGNAAVVVPVYGAPADAEAVEAIGRLFPDRHTVGLRADHVLTGGGSFHCISQQAPRVGDEA